jgi:hypothetical protein
MTSSTTLVSQRVQARAVREAVEDELGDVDGEGLDHDI